MNLGTTSVCAGLLLLLTLASGSAADENVPPARRPNTSRPGPWDNDILVYRDARGAEPEQLARFPRAGVSTLTRLKDGRIAAAHQHFPENNDHDFDKVAVRFSSDEGRTWTEARVIVLSGLPQGMRSPFDPTLVTLADGHVRLYYTSQPQRGRDRQAIYSAISSNCIDFVVEPGVRFTIDGRPVIDCAVAFHRGVFHLFAPDNGAALSPDAPQVPRSTARGYHATSKDGLNFTRQDDVSVDAARNWLGGAVSDGPVMRFFGTGPRGVWMGVSSNGLAWQLDATFAVRGADPGAVKLNDGSWLISATGPRRDARPRNISENPERPPRPAILAALDANNDGTVDQWELANATSLLRKLDRNRDGQLTSDELHSKPAGPQSTRN